MARDFSNRICIDKALVSHLMALKNQYYAEDLATVVNHVLRVWLSGGSQPAPQISQIVADEPAKEPEAFDFDIDLI